jgi:hypothetical protein
VGKRCWGTLVVRCAWVNYDPFNGRMRAYASVLDTTDARDYSVKVNDIQVVYSDPVRGIVPIDGVNTKADDDGWFDSTDEGQSGLVSCYKVRNIPDRTVYARALFSWEGYSTDSENQLSFPVKRC